MIIFYEVVVSKISVMFKVNGEIKEHLKKFVPQNAVPEVEGVYNKENEE
jgi:hypothetical protein